MEPYVSKEIACKSQIHSIVSKECVFEKTVSLTSF